MPQPCSHSSYFGPSNTFFLNWWMLLIMNQSISAGSYMPLRFWPATCCCTIAGLIHGHWRALNFTVACSRYRYTASAVDPWICLGKTGLWFLRARRKKLNAVVTQSFRRDLRDNPFSGGWKREVGAESGKWFLNVRGNAKSRNLMTCRFTWNTSRTVCCKYFFWERRLCSSFV
jgi:hypothetical protein